MSPALRQPLELTLNAIRETGRDTLTEDVDAVEEDTESIVKRLEGTITFGEHGSAVALSEVTHDHWVVGGEGVNGKRQVHAVGEHARCWREGSSVGEAVSPKDESDTVHGGGPPWWTDAARHGTDVAEDLTAMEDGFFNVVDATFVDPNELLVGAVDFFAAGELLDLGEVGDGVEADEVKHDQVDLHHGAHCVVLHIPVRETVPALQHSLDFFEADAGGGSCDRTATRARGDIVGETAEELAVLADEGLEGVEEESEVERGQLDALG